MNPVLEVTCASPGATREVAAGVARILLPGDVILLDGDLGAGKTTFTQGLAKAMGVDDVVTSPTFALVRSYPSSFGVDLIHVDVYRLDDLSEIVALGLPEMLEDGAVAAIEWGSRAAPALGPDYLSIRIGLTDTGSERTMTLVPEGPRWLARWEELATTLARAAAGVPAVTVLLGIATATSQVGVALGGLDGPMASLHVRQGRRHAELLAPAIETLTRMAGIGTQQIGRIAVDIGPGLFTGLRVGVATAKAMAAALDIPIAGCSSLDVLAHPHHREGRTVAAIVDAKRGELFWALFRPTLGAMVQVTDPVVGTPDLLIEQLRDRAAGPDRAPVLAVGDGARRYSDLLRTVAGVELGSPADDHPNAVSLVELALTRPSVPLAEITPMYLRAADVRIGWAERPASPASSGASVGRG